MLLEEKHIRIAFCFSSFHLGMRVPLGLSYTSVMRPENHIDGFNWALFALEVNYDYLHFYSCKPRMIFFSVPFVLRSTCGAIPFVFPAWKRSIIKIIMHSHKVIHRLGDEYDSSDSGKLSINSGDRCWLEWCIGSQHDSHRDQGLERKRLLYRTCFPHNI